MVMLQRFFIAVMLSFGCCSLAACASVAVADKVPPSVWAQMVDGKSLDLIVEFDDATHKRNVLSILPANEVEVLKDYETLPLMYLRFRSAATLKTLLSSPSVVKAFEDRQENLLPEQESKP